MKLSAVIDRIETGSLGYRHVAGVARLADLAAVPAPTPACFVIPAEETIRSVVEGAGLISLEATFSFDVVTMIAGDGRGSAASADALGDFHDALITRLLGWTPDSEIYRPVVPVAGRLLGISAGRASWISRFRTVFEYRKQGV